MYVGLSERKADSAQTKVTKPHPNILAFAFGVLEYIEHAKLTQPSVVYFL